MSAETRSRTWTYVRTVKQFDEAMKMIKAYLRQGSKTNPPVLCHDLETFHNIGKPVGVDRPSAKALKQMGVPRPIFDGEKWLGLTRIYAVGTDPLNPEVHPKLRGRQFLFDVPALGETRIAAAFKPIIEKFKILGQNIQYECGYNREQFGIKIKKPLDCMTGSQIYWSGDRVKHGLSAQYRTYLGKHAPGLFKQVTGMGFNEYDKYKEEFQNYDWGCETLSVRALNYSAHDNLLPFYLWNIQSDLVQEWADTKENRLKPGQGIERILLDEHRLIYPFACMETDGITFNREYYESTVVPMLEDKFCEIEKIIADKYPELRVPNQTGETGFKVTLSRKKFSPVEEQEESRTTEAADLKRNFLDAVAYSKEFQDSKFFIDKLSVKVQNQNKQVKRISVSWANGNITKSMMFLIREWMQSHPDYKIDESLVINPRAMRGEPFREALGKILGRKVRSTADKYLRGIFDPNDESTHPLKDIFFFLEARSFKDKYGKAMLAQVYPDGKVYPHWRPIGGEEGEVVSGRSSCSDPNLMSIAARKKIYAWSKEGAIKVGELTRAAFIADDGCILWDADWGNLEPRITAQRTKDQNLLRIFRRNLDMHMITGCGVLQLDKEPPKGEEGSPERSYYEYVRNDVGKIVNLGVGYGMGPVALADKLYVDTGGKLDYRDEKGLKIVKRFIDLYHDTYPGVRRLKTEIGNHVWAKPDQAGTLAKWKDRQMFSYVQEDFAGRHRRFCLTAEQEDMPDYLLAEDYHGPKGNDPYYYNEFKKRRGKVKRAAYNHLIQSVAASIMKRAHYLLFQELQKRYKSGEFDERKDHIKIVLHDELLVQAQEHNAKAMKRIVLHAMLKAASDYIIDIPVVVSIGKGLDWWEAKNAGVDYSYYRKSEDVDNNVIPLRKVKKEAA